MTGHKRRLTSIYLCAVPLFALVACKQSSSVLTAVPAESGTQTYKAKVRTMLVGPAMQACIAESPLQLTFKASATLPKNILGNVLPEDAGYSFVEILFVKGKGAAELFADKQKLFMVTQDGKRKACELKSAFMATADWMSLDGTNKPDAAVSDTKPDAIVVDDGSKVATDSVNQPGEIFALFNQKSAVKTSLSDSTTLKESEKCTFDVLSSQPAKHLRGVIQPSDHMEHFQVVLSDDIDGGRQTLCKKGAKVFVYARHLKDRPFAIKAAGPVVFKKTTTTTSDVCEFSGVLVAKMVDYSSAANKSYFKIELTSKLPGVKKEKEFCKKGSIGYVEIAQFAKGAK